MAAWFAIRTAARIIRAGGVVAYPTESVFGLGCDPLDLEAVLALLSIKQRSAERGLILIGADESQLAPFVAPLPAATQERLRATWPGPVTWVVPASDHVPPWLTGGRDTIAVRVTAHPGAAALCRAVPGALISTSANVSGRPPVRTALAARREFGLDVDYVLAGTVGGRQHPTEIRDALSGGIIRCG